MHIIILGGAGFLGKRLALALLKRRYLTDSEQEVISRISRQSDTLIQRIVGSWPSAFTVKRAKALRFETNSFDKEYSGAY
jgi:nucleoside-diphosphate-sugar epimerase